MADEYLDLTLPGEPKTVDELIQKAKARDEAFKTAKKGLRQEKINSIKGDVKQGLKDFFTKKKSKGLKRIKTPKFMAKRPSFKPVQQVITQEQAFLRGMFGGGERTFGTGQNLPEINGVLIRGKGLINNDDNGETAQMFGIGR